LFKKTAMFNIKSTHRNHSLKCAAETNTDKHLTTISYGKHNEK